MNAKKAGMRKLLFLNLIVLFPVAAAYGEGATKDIMPEKFGISVTPFLLDNITSAVYANSAKVKRARPVQFKVGLWGDYPIKESIVGQIAMEILKVETLSMPNSKTASTFNNMYVVVKAKPHFYINDNFCFFIGPQVTRLFSSNRQNYIDGISKGSAVKQLTGEITWDISFGVNYNFINGVRIGVEYIAGLSDNSVMPNKTFLSSLIVSYDFAQLLLDK